MSDDAVTLMATYNLRLVVLSIVIAIIAAYTALDLASRVTVAQGQARKLWLTAGAIAMGNGIWATHFIGMLAYDLPILMSYDFSIVFVSMVVAIIASGTALFIASRQELSQRNLLAGSMFMGLGIAAMHYLGMAAMRLEGTPVYNKVLVALSIAIAISASFIALWLAFKLRDDKTITGSQRKFGSAIVMGSAIALMHYTAMAAVSFKLTERAGEQLSQIQIEHSMLAVVIGFATLIVLSLAMLASIFQQRLHLEVAKADALRQSEERFRFLVQNASDIIAIITADSTVSYTSASIKQILGYAPEDWLNKKAIEIVHPEDQNKADNLLKNALDCPGINITSELRLQHAAGGWRDFEVIANNLLAQVEVAGIVTTYRDITARKQVQSALRQSEERYRSLIEITSQIVWDTNAEGEAVTEQPGWSAFTGQTYEELKGWGWLNAIHPDDQPHTAQLWSIAIANRTLYQVDHRLRRYDGEYRYMSVRAVPILEYDGSVREWVGVHRDFTERQQAETEREQLLASEQAARSAAEAANRMKDDFLGTLSHELRTPLNAMLGWTQMLRTRNFNETTTARALETIDRNTKSLATLIEDILDVSRIITGKLHLNVRPIELISVIEAAIDVVRPAADAKNIHIEAILDYTTALVSGDPDRLQQVVWNLLSNAVKFTPKGGRIEVRLECINSRIRISVSDTGKGISTQFLPYVFERFRQADSSTTRTHGGLGLGLAIVRHLVELHGGTVHADSSGEGQGATFSVQLPLMAVRSQNDISRQKLGIKRKEVILAPGSCLLEALRVLVVDDEPDARELLTTVLKQYGADVRAVASAGEAIAVLSRTFSDWLPDLLISDIGMPEEDGYALIRQVRTMELEQARYIPAVALTAYAREQDRVQALLAGFQIHVPKPVDPDELAAAVAKLTGRDSSVANGSSKAKPKAL